MPKIFFANMHPTFSKSLSTMLIAAGFECLTPDEAFCKEIAGPFTNTTPIFLTNVRQISKQEFIDTDIDFLFLLCIEQELGGCWPVAALNPRSKVIHYAGNDSCLTATNFTDFYINIERTF